MSNRGYSNKAKSGAHAATAKRRQSALRGRLAKRGGKTFRMNQIPRTVMEIEVVRPPAGKAEEDATDQTKADIGEESKERLTDTEAGGSADET